MVLLFAVVVVWRKHAEMREFVRAESYDRDVCLVDQESDEEVTVTRCSPGGKAG